MPYVGEHAARINPPGKYDRLRRQNNKFGKGIHVIFGVLPEGGSEVQSIHFDSEIFTPEQAQEWLKEHDYKVIEFEAAVSEEEAREQESDSPKVRNLGVPISFTDIEHFTDGSLLIRNVPLLAPGTWTDSAVGTPLKYTEKSLEKYATNWKDVSNWSRHLGGTPRDITEKIAEKRNIHYEAGKGVVGDIYYHALNERSKDTIKMILAAREGKISMPYVSVEHGGTEKYNPATREMESDEIVFFGSATVNQGACRKCRLHEVGSIPTSTDPEPITEPEPAIKEAEILTKELEAKIADLEAKNKELEAKLTPPTPPAPPVQEKNKELEEALVAIKTLTEKVKELENQPGPAKTAGGIEEQERELGTVETYVIIDKSNKTIRGS
jgi:hypothetical protein